MNHDSLMIERLRSVWRIGQGSVEAIGHRAKNRFPLVFGLPVETHLVQLYRADSDVDTHVSLANVLSFLLLDETFRVQLRLCIYDRRGRRLTRTTLSFDRHQTVQASLREIAGCELDAYGAFTVDASYDLATSKQLASLGQTAPQFMTIYVPRAESAGQAPQILHSHKRLRTLPTMGTAAEWSSGSLEPLSMLRTRDIFVINIDPARLPVQIELRPIGVDTPVWRASGTVAGWGTERFTAPAAELAGGGAELFTIHYRYDRPVSYRRPIIFRSFQNGIVTANHS